MLQLVFESILYFSFEKIDDRAILHFRLLPLGRIFA